MHVTLATPKDIPRLCELLGLLFSQESEYEADALRQARGLDAIITNPAVGLILVLRKEDSVVGMVNLLFTISTHLGAKVALFEDLIVDPAYRRKGAGTFLVQEARRIATERGCHRLTLLTDRSNAEAKAFYRKLGFEESETTPFRYRLK